MDRADAKSMRIYDMTANTFDEDALQVRNAGMGGQISKPYGSSALYAVMAQALGVK